MTEPTVELGDPAEHPIEDFFLPGTAEFLRRLPSHTRLILASEDILEQWGTRTEDGQRITVEWGEIKPEGWYEPVFTVHSDD